MLKNQGCGVEKRTGNYTWLCASPQKGKNKRERKRGNKKGGEEKMERGGKKKGFDHSLVFQTHGEPLEERPGSCWATKGGQGAPAAPLPTGVPAAGSP